MIEVKSRNTIFIEKDFPSRGSLTYSKTLREYEEEGVTQLTSPSGRSVTQLTAPSGRIETIFTR